MLAVNRDEIVDGPLARALVVLAVPLVVQNLVQVTNQVVDIFWLGRLDDAAVAGVGLVIPVLGLLFSAYVMAFVGTQVVVSQRIGDAAPGAARRAAFNGLLLALALALVVGSTLLVFAPAIVGLFRPDPVVVAYAVPYLATFGLAVPSLFLADTMEASLVGAGDSRGSLYLNAVAIGLNVVLDPLLIFGIGPLPALGVRGAALATGVGYGVGFLLAVGLVARGRNEMRLERAALTVDRGDVREIVDVGLPTAGGDLGETVIRVALVGIVSTVGGAAGLAAYTVGARVATVAVIPAQGLSQAAQSVVGQNLGASRPDRARRATWLGVGIAGGGLAVVGIVQWLVPGTLVALFVPDASAAAAALTAEYLRILAYGYPALGVVYLVRSGFNGARRTRTSMVVTLLQYWVVRLPIAVAGALLLGAGVRAVFWAVTVSNVVAAVGAAAYYRHTTRDGMLARAAERATAANGDAPVVGED